MPIYKFDVNQLGRQQLKKIIVSSCYSCKTPVWTYLKYAWKIEQYFEKL